MVLFPVNYGSLILKALLEHWIAASQIQDEADDEQAGANQATATPEYFKIPGHTPLIISEVVSIKPHKTQGLSYLHTTKCNILGLNPTDN